MSQVTKQDILDQSGLELPLKMDGKKLFKKCKESGFTRYVVSKQLLEVSNTTGRSISLGSDYTIKIDEELNVKIDKITSVK